MLNEEEKEVAHDENVSEQEISVNTPAEPTTEVAEIMEETSPLTEETHAAAIEEAAEITAEVAIEKETEEGSEETVAAVETEPAESTIISETTEVAEEEEEEVELPAFDIVETGGAAHDDFNWAMDKRGAIAYSDADRSVMLKSYDATLSNVVENEIIRGRISSISGGDIVLDINYKSDGLIPLNEFRDTPDLKPGDEVEVYVESQEDSQGQLGLSRRKAKILRAWESIVDSFKNGTIIRGTVISKTKGGLIVDCNGLETFLPGSQIDIKPVVDYDQYVGKTMEFKVVKVNEQIKNAVVSHKALIESDLAEQREQILATLDKGQVLEGYVKNITDFGAFLDLGGVDGLLYITDISWGRISHPSEVLTHNQRINVVVLGFEQDKKRISLGLKQLTPHPWDVLPEDVVEGSTVKGKIVNIEDYGAFVEIQPGVEGLVHISEITWGNQSINAKEHFKIGQELEARVVTIDRTERKMSLSVKQLSTDPWNEIEDKFSIDSKHLGVVKNITNYGIFVELSEGVGGMVHISDLSWTRRYAHPSEFTKVGSELEVIVLEIDKDKRQISLGHKQTLENPWDGFEEMFPIGSLHEATAIKRDEKGATFQLPHGLEAYAPAKHIKKEDGQLVNAGETVPVRVIEFNKEDRRILVSHTRFLEDQNKAAHDAVKATRTKEHNEEKAAINEVQKKIEKETLGDLDALSKLKDQLEK